MLDQSRMERTERLDKKVSDRRGTQPYPYSDVRKTQENVYTEGDHSEDE